MRHILVSYVMLLMVSTLLMVIVVRVICIGMILLKNANPLQPLLTVLNLAVQLVRHAQPDSPRLLLTFVQRFKLIIVLYSLQTLLLLLVPLVQIP